ncbi:TadE/TadG family type IV pilus assembly protein [Palleronia sediminis]|nr:hypothetical protein [Palleronia sediminis]
MSMPSRIAHRLRRFRRDEAGSYVAETLLILPLLIWGVLATLVYVDGYRTQTANLRISYSLSDMISRTRTSLGPNYVDGLGRIYDHLSGGRSSTSLRVTLLHWNKSDDKHYLDWSDSTDGGQPPLTQETLSTVLPRVPTLFDGDRIIVLETWMDYDPPFKTGIDKRTFGNITVTSPRFLAKIGYDPAL